MNVQPATVPPVGLTWTPAKKDIVEIAPVEDGVVSIKPLKAGKTDIAVKEPGGKNAKLTVNVVAPVESVELKVNGKPKAGGKVNIAAALHEVASKIEKPSFRELFKSGVTISRDIIGTMSNTLILAYIGSSLCSVLLIIYNNSFSMTNLFNKENIIVELLKIIVGSFGILSALPLTSAISAIFYSKFEKFSHAEVSKNEVTDDFSEMLDKLNSNEK